MTSPATTATSVTHADRILPGVALMIGFCMVAPLIDVFAKLASQSVTVTQVTFARFIVQGLVMAPLVLWLGHSLRLAPPVLRLLVLRAAVNVLSTYTFVAAVQVMPIADALAIAFVEPFILLLFGFLALGEQVGPRRIAAAAVGFAGALLVIQPNFAEFGLVALWPLATAVTFAFYILVTRRLSRDIHPVPMQFHTAWIATLLIVPVVALGAATGAPLLALSMPQGQVWLWLLGVGVAASLAHIMMTFALRFAPAATIAPLHYLEIVSAVALGWLVFGDLPNPLSWAGIVVITGSGLYIIHRERVTARAALPRPDGVGPAR
jgi:drug/metabolite transporter (DMT)-like permease